MYTVFTEIFTENGIERWFYGRYEHERANEVAYELGQNWTDRIFHSICPTEEEAEWGILNCY